MPIKKLIPLPFFLFIFLSPLPARAANLFVTKSASLCDVAQGSSVTFTIGISNQSFDNATDVVLTDLLPGNFGPATATTTQGTCDVNSGGTPNNVVCNLGTMTANALVTVTISTTLVSGGTINADIPNTATATTTSDDTDITNNSATAIVTFSKEEKLCFNKQGDTGCSMVAAPTQPTAGSWLLMAIAMLALTIGRRATKAS